MPLFLFSFVAAFIFAAMPLFAYDSRCHYASLFSPLLPYTRYAIVLCYVDYATLRRQRHVATLIHA